MLYHVKVNSPINSKIKVLGKVYTIPFILRNISDKELNEFLSSISSQIKYVVAPVSTIFEERASNA